MSGLRVTNLSQVTYYLDACDAFLTGASHRAVAAALLKKLPDDDRRGEVALLAAMHQITSSVQFALALDYIDLAKELSGPPLPKVVAVEKLTTFYRRAGEANFTLFDSLILGNIAQSTGRTSAVARFDLALKDEAYGLMYLGAKAAQEQLHSAVPSGAQRAYAELAAGLFVHSRAHLLVAKYYNLGVKLDDDLAILGIRHPNAVNDWLAQSLEESRLNIFRLRERNVDLMTCRQSYEVARVLKDRDLSDQMTAMQHLFRVNSLSRLLWHLSQPGLATSTEKVATPSSSAASKYVLVGIGKKHQVNATYRFEVTTTKVPAESMILTAAALPELLQQYDVSTRMEPEGKLGHELSSQRSPIVTAQLDFDKPEAPQRIEVTVMYEAKVLGRLLRPLKPGETAQPCLPLEEAARKDLIAESPSLDFGSKKFQAWLDENRLRRDDTESDVDFAQRVYRSLIAKYTFALDLKSPVVSEISQGTKADVNAICGLLVAVMRANAIPARTLFGMHYTSKKPGNSPSEPYALVEFFAEGIGWVPIDAGLGLLFKDESDPAIYFGLDSGDKLIQHVGCDLQIPTPGKPVPVFSFQSLFVQAKGNQSRADIKVKPLSWDAKFTEVK